MEFLGGELPARLQDHALTCGVCSQKIREFNTIHDLFTALPAKAPSVLLRQRILAMSRDDSLLPKPLMTRFWHGIFKNHGWTPVAVSLALIFAMVNLVLPFYENSKTDQAVVVPLQHEALTVDPRLQMVTNKNQASILDDAFIMPQIGEPSAMSVSLPELKDRHEQRVNALLEADADDLLMRGRRFKSLGRMDLALKDFETIYRFYPNYTYMGDVLLYRAQCYAFQGYKDRAIESLEVFSEKYPDKKSLIVPMIEQLENQTK